MKNDEETFENEPTASSADFRYETLKSIRDFGSRVRGRVISIEDKVFEEPPKDLRVHLAQLTQLVLSSKIDCAVKRGS